MMALQDGQKPLENKYFAPGEIGFVVRHPGNDAPSPNDIIDIILESPNRDLLQKTRIGTYVIDALNGLREPKGNSRFMGLPNHTVLFTPVNVEGTLAADADLVDAIKTVNDQIYKPNSSAPGLAALTLNWLSGAQQGNPVGTGGPGGLPVPAASPVFLHLDPTVHQDINTNVKKVTCDHVNVYILDTAPNQDSVESQRLLLDAQPSLIQLLFGDPAIPVNNGAASQPYTVKSWSSDFSIYYDQSPDSTGQLLMKTLIDNVNGYYIPGHDYDMCDHGLFIASLVAQHYRNFFRDISAGAVIVPPHLKIHLIQVLSDYGVGTVETFLRGVQKVIDLQAQDGNAPAVVNCSWVLTAPRRPEHIHAGQLNGGKHTKLEDDFLNEIGKAQGKGTKDDISYLQGLFALDVLFDDLRVTNKAPIVACAGNDGQRGQPNRVDARLPAAFLNVVGVTALVDTTHVTSPFYANIADDPNDAGYAIWGGDLTVGGGGGAGAIYPSNDPNSPVGLYFNQAFPNEKGDPTTPNTNGLAHWSGTSFATPIIAATFAATMAWDCPANFNRANSIILNASTPTGDNENAIIL
jgi:hypothetical protein